MLLLRSLGRRCSSSLSVRAALASDGATELPLPLPHVSGVRTVRVGASATVGDVVSAVREADGGLSDTTVRVEAATGGTGGPWERVASGSALAALWASGRPVRLLVGSIAVGVRPDDSLIAASASTAYGAAAGVAVAAAGASDAFRELSQQLRDEAQAGKRRIGYDDFVFRAMRLGASVEEARRWLDVMQATGLALHFPLAESAELRQSVLLNPRDEATSKGLLTALDVSQSRLRDAAAKHAAEIEGLAKKLKDMDLTLATAEKRVNRRARVWSYASLGYLVAQFGVIAYWVWEVESWDVMEPFTYFLNLSAVWASAFFFARRKTSPEYGQIHEKYVAAKLAKELSRRSYSKQEHEQAASTLSRLQDELNVIRSRIGN